MREPATRRLRAVERYLTLGRTVMWICIAVAVATLLAFAVFGR